MMRRIFLATTLLAIAMSAAARNDVVQQAIDARSAGDYPRAIELLRAADARLDPRIELLLAETLSWNKQFDESARLFESLCRTHPESRDATLGLARVRLWQGHYPEARRLFSDLLRRDPADVDAAEGRATAAYWSGDFRTAERELRSIDRNSSRRMLAEIRSATQPGAQLDIDTVHDDQPFQSTRSALRGTFFTDPLTRWDASAGAYRLSSTAGGTHHLPFAIARNETVLPTARLTLSASLGGIRTPDGRSHAIGSAAARFRLRPHSTLSLSFGQSEIVSNATKLFPMVRTTALRWQLDGERLASAGAERLTYSDRNHGTSADAYILLPVMKRSRWTIWAGASALARDTHEPRFYVNGISSRLDPATGSFRYTYRGAYDPYWTPNNLVEARAIASVERRIGSSAVVRLQADAGHGRDRAVGFWPESGTAPFPVHISTAGYDRSFDPRRLRLTLSTPLPGDFFLDFGFDHSVTAFYEANAFHASVGRRR